MGSGGGWIHSTLILERFGVDSGLILGHRGSLSEPSIVGRGVEVLMESEGPKNGSGGDVWHS